MAKQAKRKQTVPLVWHTAMDVAKNPADPHVYLSLSDDVEVQAVLAVHRDNIDTFIATMARVRDLLADRHGEDTIFDDLLIEDETPIAH